ncbi:MAG: hypothetical protein H7A52_14405 [Akkermansiaceae bacterium]|nr:hypothetical protein [Akkermansiaceae bacterium]
MSQSPDSPNTDEVQDNLRVIRGLMERATIYRAVSSAPALLGGLLSLAVAGYFLARPVSISTTAFLGAWLAVLAVTGLANTVLLRREAAARGAAFPSAQTRHGLAAMAPAMGCGFAIGLVFAWRWENLPACVVAWGLGYGLGLLATSSFAPGSIRRLGAAFLLAGGAGFAWLAFAAAPPSPAAACAFMGATFGGFHLVYGLLTRGTRAEPAP